MEIELPDGTILDAPDGSDPSIVAKKYLATQKAQEPSLLDVGKRQLGLTGRAMAEGVTDIASPFANVLAAGLNRLIKTMGGDFQFPEDQGGAFSRTLTDIGVPAPGSEEEQYVNSIGRFATGVAAGGPLNKTVQSAITRTPAAPPGFISPKDPMVARFDAAPQGFKVPRGTTEAARLLDKEGIPLDKAQASGSKTMERLKSLVSRHPLTTGKQQQFTETQQKAFNRSVLRLIGEDSDEATQAVMNNARSRIGGLFNQVGKTGTVWDDALQSRVADIVENAQRTVPQSELSPLMRNVDDLLNAVDDSGRIPGDILIRVRSNLSKLSRRPGIGSSAAELEDAVLDALGRSNPGQTEILNTAREQWRTLRIVQSAIGKGADKNISPLSLSNTIARKANQNMSVFGLGGNQKLVKLAEAGRTVLPEKLPSSGTAEANLLNAPLRVIATYPHTRAIQNYLLAQPGSGNSNALANIAPATAGVMDRLKEYY